MLISLTLNLHRLLVAMSQIPPQNRCFWDSSPKRPLTRDLVFTCAQVHYM